MTTSNTLTKTDLANILNEIVAIDGTDMTSQEIEDFVDSLNVTGIHAVDYIVEQGTNNGWTYRKWNSGIYEAWRLYSGTTNLTTASAGTYYGGAFVINVPSFSSSCTFASATASPSLSSGVFVYSFNSYNMELTFRAHQSVSSATCTAQLYIRGTWK